jgi:iron-sulfur cluster assembly protein
VKFAHTKEKIMPVALTEKAATQETESPDLKLADREQPPMPPPVSVTERASRAVKRIINDQRIKCLTDLAPELVEVYNTFNTKEGRAPTFTELAAAAGTTEKDLITKLGAVALGKADYMSQEQRDWYRELTATHGRAPTSAEFAARAGVPETELLEKLGTSAGIILGNVCLRIRVVGGGCSGFQHKLDLDPTVNRKLDDLYEIHGVNVVIDKRSGMYLGGVQVDFHDELHRSGFSVTNPNAKTTCGCGSSFSM